MNKKCVLLLCLSLFVLSATAGCDGGGGGPTGPANAPYLSDVTANPPEGRPGTTTVIFFINFVDVPGDLNGGTAVISMQSQGNLPYQETVQSLVSNAEGTSGTLTTSITLSPLVPPGVLFFSIFVIDLAGNSSNIVYSSILVI